MNDSNKYTKNILLYQRYVDHTLVIYNVNNRQLKLLNNSINKITPNLNFTLNIDEDNKLMQTKLFRPIIPLFLTY